MRTPSKQTLASWGRGVAPALLMLCLSTAAHAQGTIDFSGATTFMTSVKTFAIFAGAIGAFIGLVISAFGFMGNNIQRGIVGLMGAIFAAGILGWGAGWISSLSGQAVQ